LLDILESIAEVIDATPATQAQFDANKLIGSHIEAMLASVPPDLDP
jgi:hypothetical protein